MSTEPKRIRVAVRTKGGFTPPKDLVDPLSGYLSNDKQYLDKRSGVYLATENK